MKVVALDEDRAGAAEISSAWRVARDADGFVRRAANLLAAALLAAAAAVAATMAFVRP